MAIDDAPVFCSTCGRELAGDRDVDTSGPNGPICGDCARRAADDEDFENLVLIDLLDGELDGQLR